MKAYNVQWDIDINDAISVLDQKTSANAAQVLGIPEAKYANMTTSERHDYAYSYFHNCPGAMEDLFELPECIEVPENITDEEDISDWLSDEYGFCHNGFALNTDEDALKRGVRRR